MRIGLLSQSVDDESGIGRIVLALAREFHAAGHEVHCHAQHFSLTEQSFVARKVPGIRISRGLSKLAYRWGGPQPREQYDILHAFGVGEAADIVSAQSCHLAGMRLLQDFLPGVASRQNWGLYDRVSLADERRLLTSSHTKRIIAVSHLVRNQIVESYKIDPERVVVIPNGVDLARFVPLDEPASISRMRKVLGIPEERFVLLFVGNEFERKGLHYLLRALASMNNKSVHLLVVGKDDPSPFRRLANGTGCGAQVTFAGKIAGLERMYSLADAFVFPSLYEPFGMVIVEAMAAGLPVIASARCGAVEGLKHGEHGLYVKEPADTDELARNINCLLSDTSLREKLSRVGREESLQFAWTRIASRMLEAYKEAGSSSHEGRGS